MAKPELGTKRLCGSCGAKFYDLSKDPIICPKCGTVFEVVAPAASRGRAMPPRPPPLRPRALRRCRRGGRSRAGQGGRGRGAGDRRRRVGLARGRRRRGRRARRPKAPRPPRATTISRSRRPKRRPSSRRPRRATTTSPTSSARVARTKRRLDCWNRQSVIGVRRRCLARRTGPDSRSGGAIAQLGERLNGIQEVGGSTPPGSTIPSRMTLTPAGASRNCLSSER